MIKVSDIWIYPVKSLGGTSVARAEAEPWGLAGDRRWMVVDPDGRFLTQRQCPLMATVEAVAAADGVLLTVAGHPPRRVATPDRGADTLEVVVWRDRLTAAVAGPDADAFLSEVLGRSCRLVHMADPAVDRPVDPDVCPDDHVSFADGFPLLLTSTASLADLNARLPAPVPMDRFRPNLVIDGALPWAEDGWRALRIGAVPFAAVKPCARCVVTSIDQRTGSATTTNEPIRTLQTFRRDARGQVTFGQNLVARGGGVVRLGDPVTLIA